ncbi:MAG: methyltransferase domain-containing protein [Sedimenticolaceae bacterium]
MTGHCIYREENDDMHLEIWEDGDRRSLWFDDVILQTEINIHDPAVLPNPVNRAMLAHLMFGLPLQRVLLAGCGGGAIARWLHARAPQVHGDAIEVSGTVARLAREYFEFPPPDGNWELQVADAREHILFSKRLYDYILVDLEENQTTPRWVTEAAFLEGCHDHLSAHGNLTLNLLLDDATKISEALLRIRQTFGSDILLLSNPGHDNLLVLAFRAHAPQMPSSDALVSQGRRWGIDFASLAARLTRLTAAAGAP